MSRLQLRAAVLAQGRDSAPPEDPGSVWVLDVTRLPAGYTLSNGNQTMLSKALQANQLDTLLDRVISVDEVRQFKVSPASYGLLTSHFGCAPKDILFVSSNAWDVIGAGWFGLTTFWVNRQNLPFEEIGPKPTYTGANLNDVLASLPA